jgi:hypothetical protein
MRQVQAMIPVLAGFGLGLLEGAFVFAMGMVFQAKRARVRQMPPSQRRVQ